MQIKQTAEYSAAILKAFLDVFEHPAWISDPNGVLLMNTQAEELVDQGFSPRDDIKPAHEIVVKGKPCRVTKRDLNHGTGCLLHELRSSDDQYLQRIQDSTRRLAAALEARVPVLV